MNKELLLKELEYARQANESLPHWKKAALENARKVEIKLGYIEDNQGKKKQMGTINFYGRSLPYFEFSNFLRDYPIELKGKSWPSTEHYFQAQKFQDDELQEEIRQAKTPAIAANMGRDRKNPLRKDWESVKDNVMRVAVRAKFTQHPELKQLLINTGDAKLIEHTYKDNYWGDGGDGSGKNMLGIILMEVRKELKEQDGRVW